MENKALGKHIIMDLSNCKNNSALINHIDTTRDIEALATKYGATVLSTESRSFGENTGFTCMILLAESHISVHTWPEYDVALVDVFTCGDAADTTKIAEEITLLFGSVKEKVHVIQRG